MANYTTPTNDQYTDLRSCSGGISNTKVIREIGKFRNFFDCNSEIVWFKETDDFSIMTYEPDELTFEHTDVATNMALKQTSVGDSSIEWTKEIGIKAQYGSKFLQSVLQDFANEGLSGDNGKGLIAMANGGIWYRETIVYNEGQADEFRSQVVYPNLKVETWLVPFSGNINAETEYTIALMVQNFPVYYWDGTAPVGYGLPTGIDPIVITYDNLTLVGTTLTLSALTLTDTNTPGIIDVDITEPVKIEVKDPSTGSSQIATFPGDGSDATIDVGFTISGSLDVIITWVPMEEKSIPYKVVEVTATI